MIKNFKPKYIKKILVDRKEIEKRIADCAQFLNKKFKNAKEAPIIISILKGAIPFYGRLTMELNFDMVMDFIVLSSFRGGMQRTGMPQIVTDLMNDIKGRDVVIVEDVVDTARTLSILIKYLKLQKPKSITTVVLVDKADMRKVPFKPDYACFTLLGNPFLIGYGLDIKEKARNIPYLATFNKDYLDKI